MALADYPVWTIPPDWMQPVREGLEWRTFVAASQIGAEQRQSVRRSPRRYLDFNITAIGSWRQYFDSLMTLEGLDLFYFPAWHEACRLRLPLMALTDSTMRIIGSSIEMAATKSVFIQGDKPWKYELAEVTSVDTVDGDTVLTLASVVEKSWSYRTRVFPCAPARILQMPSYSRLTDNIVQTAIRFDFEGPNDWLGTASFPTYRTFPVIEIRPDEGQDQGGSYFRYEAQVDNDVGLIFNQDFAGVSFSTINLSTMLIGRAATETFRSILYELRGRAGQGWFVQPTADFVMSRIAPAHATALTVERSGFHDTGGANIARQDIRILMRDGTEYYRRITSGGISSYNDEWEVLNLDTEVTSAIHPKDVARISFLSPGRLDADLIEIQHQTDTDGVAVAQIAIRTIPDQRSAADWEPPPLVDTSPGDCAASSGGFWARVNGGDWNGDPDANPDFRSGAVPFNFGHPIFASVGFNSGSGPVNANFGARAFLHPLPSRAAAYGQATQWDEDQKGPGLVLEEDTDTGLKTTAVAASAATARFVKATRSTETQFGLRYYEVVIVENSQNNYVGFVSSTTDVTSGETSLTETILIGDGGDVLLAGNAVEGVNAGAFTTGDVVSICVYTVNP